MEDKSLLMIVLAFILGCMCSQMMKSMCGGRLVEGEELDECEQIKPNYDQNNENHIIMMSQKYINDNKELAKENMDDNIKKVQQYYDCKEMNNNNRCILDQLDDYSEQYENIYPYLAKDIDIDNMKKINKYLACIGIEVPYPDIPYPYPDIPYSEFN